MLLDITKQCCDADDYLDIGYLCAKAGECYNALRPIGVAYWFSLPYRFDGSLDLLVYLQLFLFLVATLTATRLFASLTGSWLLRAAACLLFAGALWFYLAPTFFVALSDTPATLLCIEAVLLLIWAAEANSRLLYSLAGVCFGCAALLRAAYFLPLAGAGIALGIVLFVQRFLQPKQVRLQPAYVLSFLLPVSIQLFITWQHTGHPGFVSSNNSKGLTAFYLQNQDGGYDTRLPAQGVYWSATTNTLLARWQFYFGSDSRSNFFESGSRNFLDSDYAEKIGLGSHWSHENVQVAVNSVMSPVNDITASRIYPASPGSAYLESRSLFALPAGDYIYRVWLWQDTPSTAPTTLQLTHQLTDYNRDTGLQTVTLRTDNITLSSAPKEYIFPVSTIGPGYIQSRFGVPTSFAIWGAVLTPATHSQSYQREPHVVHLAFPPTSNSPANITRQYSTALLAFHSLLLCFAGAYLLISAWRRKSPAHVFLFTLLMLVLLEALLVIPEQRFMQLILACNILLAVLACGSWSRNPKRFWMN